MDKIINIDKENTDIDLNSIPKELKDIAESTTYEEIAEGIESSKNVIKVYFLKIGELLYLEQIKFNLDLKRKFNVDNLGKISYHKRKGAGYYDYAIKKHNMGETTIRNLIKVYERFGVTEPGEPAPNLPFNTVHKLRMVINLPDSEIDEILRDTFIFNNKEVEGRNLTKDQLREVVREKRELQEQLKKQDFESKKEIAEKTELIVKLTKEKKDIEDNFDARINEELSKATIELSKVVENQIKAKYSNDINIANKKLKEAEVKQAEATAQLKKLENTKKAIMDQKNENDRMIKIINEKEKVMEEYDKNRRVLEAKINELNNTVAGLNNQKKDLAEGIQRVKEISEFTKCLNEMITLSNEFEKDVYSDYINHEDIRKYLVPTVNNALESLHRFDNKLHHKFEPTIVDGNGVEVTNE